MKRIAALFGYIEETRALPYDATRHNCALFAAGAIRAMTGRDPVTELGVSIRSQADVDAALADGGVRGLCERYFGYAAYPPLWARRGDVVIKPGEAGETLGICAGDHALFLGPDGLQRRELDECSGCWRVE